MVEEEEIAAAGVVSAEDEAATPGVIEAVVAAEVVVAPCAEVTESHVTDRDRIRVRNETK